jgi:hypothetical protein
MIYLATYHVNLAKKKNICHRLEVNGLFSENSFFLDLFFFVDF